LSIVEKQWLNGCWWIT